MPFDHGLRVNRRNKDVDEKMAWSPIVYSSDSMKVDKTGVLFNFSTRPTRYVFNNGLHL